MDQRMAHLTISDDATSLNGGGSWTIGHLTHIEAEIHSYASKAAHEVTVDMTHVDTMDSAGALLLEKFLQITKSLKKTVKLTGLKNQYTELLKLIEDDIDQTYKIPHEHHLPNVLAKFGEWMINKSIVLTRMISFFGIVLISIYNLILNPRHLSLRSIAAVFHNNCYRALPIVALLNFLIGIVITYQMGLELKSFGMNMLIVNLSAMIMLREFAPLMSAIVASGRTSTSFTAQIGSMILNEEVDALRTMGVSPTQVLVIPKLIGTLVAFPLLIVWADFFALAGSILTAKIGMGISPAAFIEKLHQINPMRSFLIGLLKTPFFAIIVTIIGCFQGFSVEKNAASIGLKTTQSAVQSLFFIIILNSLFSIWFSWGNV